MVNKHLMLFIILIVYVYVCWNSVAVVLNDTKTPLTSSQHYMRNEDRADSHLNINAKTAPVTVELSSPRTVMLTSKQTSRWSATLPMNDFKQLIDLQNFQYLVHQPVCSDHIEALILIHSAPKNYEKRQIIRETWGSIANQTWNSPFRVLFLLGEVESEELQDDLLTENTKYRDIIQGSFIDDYRNMTYKHIMAFKWYLYNCPQAQILLKVDDDVYVNTPQLHKYFRQQQQHQHTDTIDASNTWPTTTTTTPKSIHHAKYNLLNIFSQALTPATFNASRNLFNHPENLLFCDKVIGARVSRSFRSKWRMSFKEYSESRYPSYCSGYVLIYSSDVVLRLYKAAQNFKYFWVDDVHITGVLAHKTNTTITTASSYILNSYKCDQLLRGKINLHELEFIYAWYKISPQQIKSLWDLQIKSFQSLYDLRA